MPRREVYLYHHTSRSATWCPGGVQVTPTDLIDVDVIPALAGAPSGVQPQLQGTDPSPPGLNAGGNRKSNPWIPCCPTPIVSVVRHTRWV